MLAAMTDSTNTNKERIAKRMANAGVCSRREAERWIEAGRVKVNGEMIRTPAFTVGPNDEVEVDGDVLGGKQEARLFIINKPRGVMCTTDDPEGRKTIFHLIPKDGPRVVLVGRLDFNSEGLLLLATDGGMAQKLMRSDLERVYRVRAMGNFTEADLDKLRKGIRVEGVLYKPMKVEAEQTDSTKESGRNKWYRVTLIEGKNREIRNAFEAIGGQVNRLIRTSYGPITLGKLPSEGIMEVPRHQLKKLMSMLDG